MKERKIANIEEVNNYKKALEYGVKELESRPLCLSLIRDIHAILLQGVRGTNKARGEFRKVPNYIGSFGTTIEQASFIPPSPDKMLLALNEWEKYIHNEEGEILIQLAVIHAQFEIIHPFLDGNGRVGRILIPLFLYARKYLNQPIFYLSEYLESYRGEYYDRLLNIPEKEDWQGWIEFFLRAIIKQSEMNQFRATRILELYDKTKVKVKDSQILDLLFKKPILTAPDILKEQLVKNSVSKNRLILKLHKASVLNKIQEGSGQGLQFMGLVSFCGVVRIFRLQYMHQSITPLSFIYQICKPYRKWYVFLCLAPIANGFILASINYAIKIIIDTVSGDVFTWQVFAWPLGIFVTAEICSRVFWSLHDYSEYKLHGKVMKNIYIKVFEYLQNHSYSYFQNNFSGSLISKSKSIVKGFWNFWDNISHRLLESFSVIIINIIMIGVLSLKMLIPFGISIVIIMLLAWFNSKQYEKYSYQAETNVHKFLGFYSDKITNILTILNFATKQREIKEIRDLQDGTIVPIVNKMNYFNFISWVFLGTLYTTIVLLLFVYAIYLRQNGIITTGTLAAIILVIYGTVREIFALVNSLLSFISGLADFRASLDGIFVEQEVIDKPNSKELII